jgi:hypothetical protein
VGIGSHQTALKRQDQVMSGSGGTGSGRIGPSQGDLKASDSLGKSGRAGALAVETEPFRKIEQNVGLGQQTATVGLGCKGEGAVEEGSHGRHGMRHPGPG